ncbi:MAG TPA: dienelactone hydrolase family protein [Bryobacteraceae bacterium]|nr:dienelactone hydrolase family protein [Bryobacteraceae bacterium]
MPGYDPFVRGPFPVGVRTIQSLDETRNRSFPCEIWYPAAPQHHGQDLAPETQDVFTVPPGDTPRRQTAVRNAAGDAQIYPAIVFSHHSGGHRRAATFLCTHLSSHGYIVAALDHSEVSAPELRRREGESAEQKAARMQAMIDGRVPDVSFLLDCLLRDTTWESQPDPKRIGIVGHSFGGWTALAAPETDSRFQAIVALAPAGASNPRPGILPVTLTFAWASDVPVLYLVAGTDVSLPLPGMYELFDRTEASKRMIVLRRADHMHFMDNVEEIHEAVRQMTFPEELSWLPREMKPIAELSSGDQAHLFVRGLTVAHLDAVLKQNEDARRFWRGEIIDQLTARGVEAVEHQQARSGAH